MNNWRIIVSFLFGVLSVWIGFIAGGVKNPRGIALLVPAIILVQVSMAFAQDSTIGKKGKQ